MAKDRNRARGFRDWFITGTDLGDAPPDANVDEYLNQQLSDYYASSKAEWKEIEAQGGQSDSKERKLAGMNVFLSAIGLFAFGDLEKVTDIVDCLPFMDTDPLEPGGPIRLVSVLENLLPLPSELKPKFPGHQAKEIKAWVEAHKARLIWQEDLGRFVLLDDET